MSQPRSESSWPVPRGDPSGPPAPVPEDEDALVLPAKPAHTDDAPTVISRLAPRLPSHEGALGVRGQRLAHFELIEAIGVGGMAAVLRARDTQLDRIVALKVLPPDMATDGEVVRRFHQEARSAAKLDHENIARVFYCGEDQRLHFIAFEYVEGDNLRTILERRGRLPVGEALHYMLQVAAGLSHAARRGVVHRDIKPSNIIITPGGRAKLVDMGLARNLERKGGDDLTQSGVTLGTFDYISPEQALEPRDADVRSDIYSLGCTLYHMLTGRPPVPEGTAAKKLHHHQQVKPHDPREYVRDLPDSVAFVLARMMAESPRDRYQSPEEVVQDILRITRDLGTTADVPQAVLSVETSLPDRSRGHPLLLAGLAVAAVVALIVVLDTAGPSPTPPTTGTGVGRGPEVRDRTNDTRPGPDGPKAPEDKGPRDTPRSSSVAVYEPPAEGPVTADDLAAWLEKHQDAAKVVIKLGGDLDLFEREEGRGPGLVIKARQQVVLQGLDRERPLQLRFEYDGGKYRGPLVGLTIQAPEVVVEDVRLVLALHESPDISMTGLLLTGGRKHRLERCEFIQAGAAFREEGRLASVVVDAGTSGAGRGQPEAEFRECCFLGFGRLDAQKTAEGLLGSGADVGGQDAIVRRGPAKVTASQCAFGPHASTFRLEGPGVAPVQVRQCSLLAGRKSAVFDIQGAGGAEIDVAHSLVARMGEIGAGGKDDLAVLVRQADVKAEVKYEGHDNRYGNLDAWWVVGDKAVAEVATAGWSGFLARARDDLRLLTYHPWRATPEQQLRLLEGPKRQAAFQAQDSWAGLRHQGRSTTQMVGVERLLGGAVVAAMLPDLDEKAEARARRYLVVEKGGKDLPAGLYHTVNQAVLHARAGDVVLLRQNDAVPIDTIQLNKKDLTDLTIRRYRHFHPTLVLADEATDLNASLFRLHDGKLRLEGLEVRLRPDKGGFQTQSVVVLAGDGECVLKDCLVTMERGGRTGLALAALVEAGKVMRIDMPPARTREQGPRLALEDCFVRGEGNLLSAQAGRPCALGLKNAVVALGGSLFNLEIPAEAPAAPAGVRVDVGLDNVTTFLGGPVFRLAVGKNVKAMVPVRVQPNATLFVPGCLRQPLVFIQSADEEEKVLGERLQWSAGVNGYGAYKTAVEYASTGEAMAPLAMEMKNWKSHTGEENSELGVELMAPPSAEAAFAALEPLAFRPRTGTTAGANLTTLAGLLARRRAGE